MDIGKIRQSNVVMNYGPGAIIDFRVPVTGAAVSVVAAGLEEWQKQADQKGASSQDMKRLTEPRLAEKLRVSHFRMPPVAPDEEDDQLPIIPLVGARFPGWLQCPSCHTLKPARKWGRAPGDPSRVCDQCSAEAGGDSKVYAVPVRFVMACRDGHLEDFPWSDWVHGNHRCNSQKFTLRSEGPGLAGLVLRCTKCHRSRSMEHIFTKDAHADRTCRGKRPWIAEADEECTQKPVTLQRGASNLYFPLMQSALVIPPWSEEIIRQLGYRWNDISTITTKEQRRAYVESIWNKIKEDIGDVSVDAFLDLMEEKISETRNASSGNLRWDEYRQFMVSGSKARARGDEFEVRPVPAPGSIPHIQHLFRVVSLKEIRALEGFTRIEPLPGSPPVRKQYLSRNNMGWLPAIEVRGEGIFISLNMDRLSEWESKPEVLERAAKITNFNESRVLNPDNDHNAVVSQQLAARFLLLHSLAHALMKQLSLQCGYSSASLRERLYVGSDKHDMAGLMIYTATSDSDGTLGGLQRQGESARFAPTFMEAIRANEWCSSDPLCIKGLVAATESSSLAACHSCMLAPETSCEDFNRYLDRAMLIGTPEDRSIGFFSDLLS